MKVTIVTTQVPFVYGGAEFLADSLLRKLREHGHSCELVKLPFRWQPPQKILEHMLAARLVRLRTADRIVALKFPAYYVPHEDKVLWLLHQFRQAYDLWETPYQDLPSTTDGVTIREAIIRADNQHLRQVSTIYTNSMVVSNRLYKFNGIGSKVLYPPLSDPDIFHCDSYQDYIFYPSRINAVKRQHLIVEAMRYTKSRVRLIIAGNPEETEYIRGIKQMVNDYDLERKVTILPLFITEHEKAHLFSQALASAYIPFDEDSYGYVTLESFRSRKAVITCVDSGGTLDLVKDGFSGFLVPPDPQRLAVAMDRLMEDRVLAETMGSNGFQDLLTREISWERVVRSLTE